MRNSDRNPAEQGFAPTTTWRSYLAEVPAWLIVGGALAVSFWTQVFAVGRHDLAYWEALIWGASTDAGTIAFLFLAREGIHRGTPTWGAWLGSGACAFMSVQWNVIPAWAKGDYLGVEAHLWMPALALGTWYWLLHGRRRQWTRTPQFDPDPEPPAPPPSPLPLAPAVAVADLALVQGNPVGTTNGHVPVTLSLAQSEARKLRRKGRLNGTTLGAALNVSAVSGRKWLRRVEAAEANARPFRGTVSGEAAA